MVGIPTRPFNSGGQSPAEEGHHDPFATEPRSDRNTQRRTITPEQIAAAREDQERYLAAELERAARPTLPDADAEQGDVDDFADDGDEHVDEAELGDADDPAEWLRLYQERCERKLSELQAATAREEAEAAAEAEHAEESAADADADKDRAAEA